MNKGHGTLPASHIAALDVLRGVAILGTLLTNIWIFANLARDFDTVLSTSTMAQEITNWFTGTATGPKDELLVDFLLYLVSDGKFLGLLTIMFGIGMEIQRQSALRRGRPWPGGYRWRAGLLVLEGLLHYIFIFSYDVLMGYGLIALVVAGLLARSEKVQNWAIDLSVSAHLVVLGLITAINWQGKHAADMDLNAMGDDASSWEELFPDTAQYWPMVQDRLANFWSGRYEVAIMFAMGIALFLIGARLYRAGLFLPAQSRLRRRPAPGLGPALLRHHGRQRHYPLPDLLVRGLRDPGRRGGVLRAPGQPRRLYRPLPPSRRPDGADLLYPAEHPGVPELL